MQRDGTLVQFSHAFQPPLPPFLPAMRAARTRPRSAAARFPVSLGILAHCLYWSGLFRLNSAICLAAQLGIGGCRSSLPLQRKSLTPSRQAAEICQLKCGPLSLVSCLARIASTALRRFQSLPRLSSLTADASIPFISPMKRAQKYFSSSAKEGRIFILGPEYPMCGSCWGVSCGFARWPPFEYSLKPWRRAVQVGTVKNGADSPCGIRPEPQMGTKKLRRAYPKGCENAVFYLPARLTALKAY